MGDVRTTDFYGDEIIRFSPLSTEFDVQSVVVYKGTMDLRWRHVEAALIRLLNIEEGHLGAFRARVRHLKSVGIPDIPKTGSGTQILYTRQHVIDTYIALLIMRFGVAPKSAAHAVAELHDRNRHPRAMDFIPERGDFFFILFLMNDQSVSTWSIRGIDRLMAVMSFEENETTKLVTPEAFDPISWKAYSTINVTKCLRAVDAALKH